MIMLSIATVIILSCTALFSAVLFSKRHDHKTKQPFECGCIPFNDKPENTFFVAPAVTFLVLDALIILFLAIFALL